MKSAQFDPNGGPISAAVTCSPTREGSYDLILWEAGANQRVKTWPGTFLNTDDDEYDLPKPNGKNDGRILELRVVVSVPPGVGASTVSLVVSQDGSELASEGKEVLPGTAGGLVLLFAKLEAK